MRQPKLFNVNGQRIPAYTMRRARRKAKRMAIQGIKPIILK